MVSVPARREQVALAAKRGLSQRRACTLIKVARSALHYRSRLAAKDAPVVARMAELSAQYPRLMFGTWTLVAAATFLLNRIAMHAVIVWRPRTRVDETLDVLEAHGIAGMTGILYIGFVAQAAWNGVSDGLFYGGGGELLGDQALAALVAPIYAFVVTYVLLRALGSLMPLRATAHEESIGMDVVQHGEEAYVTGEGAILVSPEAGIEAEVPVADPA